MIYIYILICTEAKIIFFNTACCYTSLIKQLTSHILLKNIKKILYLLKYYNIGIMSLKYQIILDNNF